LGFSHSFVAVKGADRAQALERLGLADGGRTGDLDIILKGFGATELKGGWLLVGCDDFEFPQNAPLAALSALGEVVSCCVEEHVMFSEARGFAGGAQAWRVTHDPESARGGLDLQVEGEPPAAFAEIRDRILAEQAAKGDADYVFDIPGRVAESLCGFFFGESEGTFVELEQIRTFETPPPPRPRKPGFFGRLFGRA
jgi:hypothetical protein